MVAVACLVQAQGRSPVKRAKVPAFDSTTKRAFFPDIFSKLVGERPTAAETPAQAAQSPGAAAVGGSSEAAAASGWSRLISATTLEDEVKAIKLAADKNLTTPTDFAGRGHKEIRRNYTMLAIVFAVIADYDGDVRWKKDAAAARDAFALTASNAKAGGNINVYNAAKKRNNELGDLLNGSSLAAEAQSQETEWVTIADRSAVMQRLEQAGEKNLAAWTASPDAFTENTEHVLHEAEILAMLADVLTREGMEDADDEQYAKFAALMRTNARQVVDALKLNNADQARQAVGEIAKACSDCHDNYR